MIIWPAKDPAEELDYSWTVPVDGEDTVETFTPTRISGSVTLGSSANTDTVASLWLTGGTADELSYINLLAVTFDGRTFREVGVLPVIDRAAQVIAAFRLMHSAFAALDDGPISYWLAKAAGEIGTNWSEDSRDDAKGYWAAHMLVGSGALAGTSAAPLPAGATSFRSGTFSASVSDAVAARTGFQTTVYGQEFLRLRRRAFAGPTLMGYTCA